MLKKKGVYMNRNIWTTILLSCFTALQAEIVSANFEITENHYINLEKHTLTKFNQDSITTTICSNDSTLDLLFCTIGLWDGFVCGGKTLALNSKHSIYKIKKTSVSTFSTSLDTTDTTIFEECVNYISRFDCPYSSAVVPSFSNPCPDVIKDWHRGELPWFLGKTHADHFFIFRYDTTFEDASLPHSGNSVVRVSCFIQTDGTLNFRKAFESPINNNVRKFSPNNIVEKSKFTRKVLTSDILDRYTNIYDIQGKHISVPGKMSSNLSFHMLGIIHEK
jgi:hypothetical protein